MSETIIEVRDSLAKDLDTIRCGKMSFTIAKTIVSHANAIFKAENIVLQRERIEERVDRIK